MSHLFSTQSLAAAALVLGTLAGASAAHARSDVYFSVGVQTPGVYVQSAPVYVQPRPVYTPNRATMAAMTRIGGTTTAAAMAVSPGSVGALMATGTAMASPTSTTGAARAISGARSAFTTLMVISTATVSSARGPPLCDDCGAQTVESVAVEPDWDLAAQPAPDNDVDRLVNL